MYTPLRWPPSRPWQRGEGLLSLLMPLIKVGAKAIGTGALSGAASWGVKKALGAIKRKKRVGKISWAQAQANQRLVRNMRNRWIKMAEAK